MCFLYIFCAHECERSMICHELRVFPWMISRRVVAPRSVARLSIACNFTSASSTSSQMDQLLYTSAIDAEPLYRYRKGGYHPITLGNFLKNGRYKILDKLGWRGYSTVWAARDQSEEAYAAVKVSVSERENNGGHRELQVMKELASIQPRPQHVMCLLDDFDLEGPNGTHKCLVFELLGPSIPDTIDAHLPDRMLPGKLAKVIAKTSSFRT
ncbi:hypothetical protein V1509DRAFT_650740 [Lipomyces kononenkoae]